ncbi:gamma-glutamylcyclotransferase [Halobacillus salinarum]|uniref:Gamma-glutamylcyclotransferase n=1 Tax=Halobacillus salinarum TaxID=2932257 RepID=A0ABY4EEA9_9BACI|nr:gamma-glutamylcyclotransferase [Halobacillus salinarum]UOQ42795.1 gamma-glutamylcyclotransferase [Halobacillus salinarum]
MKLFVYGDLEIDGIIKSQHLLAEQAWVQGLLLKEIDGNPIAVEDSCSLTYGSLYEFPAEDVEKLILKMCDSENQHFPPVKQIVEVLTDNGSFEAVTFISHSCSGLASFSTIPFGNWPVQQLLQNSTCYYFAYGSCMDNERFYKHKVSHLFTSVLGRGILDEYRLAFSHHQEDGGRADIIESSGGKVEGVIYEIEKEAVNYLFKREGVYAGGYRPTAIEVELHNGRRVTALSFTVIDKKQELVPPLHYAIEIHRGGSQYLGKDYVKSLESRFIHSFTIDGFNSYLEQVRKKD